MDVLSYEGKVFEHRIAEKGDDGEWSRRVIFKDVDARPPGYNGLTKACTSCHNRSDGPGTGGYATGMVPGSDTVVSEMEPQEHVGAFQGGGIGSMTRGRGRRGR
jgi:hypothetical protein